MPQCKALTCWTEKSKLEKILIVSIIVISAFALAVSCAYLTTFLVGKEKKKEEHKKNNNGIKNEIESKSHIVDDICLTESCISSAALIIENMDSTIAPCEDFYQFACGNYLKATDIPQDQKTVLMWGTIVNSLRKQLKNVLEEPIQTDEFEPFKVIKIFYKTCMNEDLIEKDGLNTIRSILKKLGGWPVVEGDNWPESKFDWKELSYAFRKIGFAEDPLFKVLVLKHFKHSERRVIHIIQLPKTRKRKFDKRQWTDEEVKKAYFRYMVESSVQFGADRNRSESELREPFDFEDKLFLLSKQSIDPYDYEEMSVNSLQQEFPNLNWMEYINKLLSSHTTITTNETLLVNKKYLKGVESLLATVSKRALANYMIWKFIFYCTPFLNKELREARLKYTQVFTGITTYSERSKYCLDYYMALEDDPIIERESLFIALGALYVRKYFSKKDKENAEEMIRNIYRTFQDTLEHIKWMDEATRKKSLDKLKAMAMYTAYPDEFLDDQKLALFYNDLKLDENNFLKSILKLNLFDIHHHFKRLREPIDESIWIIQGQILNVNANYDLPTNSINLPAGMLNKRIFSNDTPRYLIYGTIGCVIGHEFAHGFDTRGSEYDEYGNLYDWWTPKIKDAFRKKARCFAEQYSKYKLPEPELSNMTMNGNLTVTENVADNGGFAASYKAYKEWIKKNGEEKLLPGLKYTQMQLFWISRASISCGKSTLANLQRAVYENEHPPSIFRVLGPLSNNEDFAKDFQCAKGSKMNPNEKCKLW